MRVTSDFLFHPCVCGHTGGAHHSNGIACGGCACKNYMPYQEIHSPVYGCLFKTCCYCGYGYTHDIHRPNTWEVVNFVKPG